MSDLLLMDKELDFTANSRTKEVVIYQDRAWVKRNQRLCLKKGENRIIFTNLGHGISEDTIKTHLHDTMADLQVVSTRLETKHLYLFKEKEDRAVYEEILVLIKEIITQENQNLIFSIENKTLQELRDYIQEALNAIMLEQESSMTKLEKAIVFLNQRLEKNLLNLIDSQSALERLREKLEILREKLEGIRQFDRRTQNNIEVILICPEKREIQLDISYIIKGAQWKVSYDAKLDSENAKVTLSYFGEIRQTTGELWEKAQISLSTSQSQAAVNIPSIYPVYLSGYTEKREKGVYVQQQQIQQLVQSNRTEKSGGGSLEGAEPMPEVEAPEETPSQPAASIKKKLTHVFPLAGETTIPPDKEWHRLEILEKEIPAQLSYETIPSVLEFVYLKASFTNSTNYPLLQGPVQIFRNQSYMGQSKIKYTAPNENMALSFGIDEDLKVKRILQLDTITPAKGLNLKNTREYKYAFVLYNYKDQEKEITLKEAIHQSELREIEVQITKESTKDYRLNKEGILSWTLKLPSSAFEFKTLILNYKITAPKSYDLGQI